MKKEDQEWFDALAGKANYVPKTGSQIEADAVRRALTARRDSIEKDALNFEPQKLEAIKTKLRKEGFLQDTSAKSSNPFVSFIQGITSINSGTAVIQKIGVIAAILFVGLALRVTYFGPKNDDAMLLRGDANVTYIIDANVENKVNELVTGLKDIKAEFTQKQESYGKVTIEIRSSDAVLAYLNEKRIDPKVIDGYITIVVTPPNLKSK